MRCILAGCIRAIVAAEAVAGHAGMIERRAAKTGGGLVAILAHVGRGDVIGRLASRRGAVVAS